MKPIKDMSLDEMVREMRRYQTREGEKYIFVSYSHLDRDEVYPVVLNWMRSGYNVYIDLDFANHGSDENWVDLMRRRIQSLDCALVAAFSSKNSACSYATLLELLTVSSDKVTKAHHMHPVPIDIIEIETIPDNLDLDTPGINKAEYQERFAALKNTIGNSFGKKNPQERDHMEKCLESWYKQKGDKLGYTDITSADEMLEMIVTSYSQGATDFYPMIAFFSALWRTTFGLNGNTKTLNDPLDVWPSKLHPKEEAPPATVQAPAAPVPAAAAEVPSPEPEPRKEETVPFAPPIADCAAADVSIGRVRRLFAEDEAFCRRAGELRRSELPRGGCSAMDLAMAAVLGGCNKVHSPAQINYYRFAVSDLSKKRDSSKLGATWTWSSNCRKLLYGPKAGSGKINEDTDSYFVSLPEDTTLGEILDGFRQGREHFESLKPDLVAECLEKFTTLLCAQETA